MDPDSPDYPTDPDAVWLLGQLEDLYDSALTGLDHAGLAQFTRAENTVRDGFRQALRPPRKPAA